MSTHRALLLLAAAAVGFGTMSFAAKQAAEAGVPGAAIAFWRFVVMALPLVVPAVARSTFRFQRLDLLLYRGLFGGLAVLLYFVAIEHIPVGTATLLNHLSPIFAAAFAAWFLGERVSPRLAGPFALALLGVILLSRARAETGEWLRFGLWELAALASALLAGAAVTAIRAARRTEGSWAIYGSFTLFGLLATLPFALPGLTWPNSEQWWLLVVVGVLSIGAQLLMTYAYRWATNLQAGAVGQIAVLTAAGLGVAFLGEPLGWLKALGMACALAGVVGVVAVQATPRAFE